MGWLASFEVSSQCKTQKLVLDLPRVTGVIMHGQACSRETLGQGKAVNGQRI